MKKALKKAIGFMLVLTLLITTLGFSASAKFTNSIDFSELESDSHFVDVFYLDGKRIILYKSNENDIRKPADGAAFYIVDEEEKTVTFYGGDGTVPNEIYSKTHEFWGRRLAGVTENENIEHIVFTDNYIVNGNHLMFMDNVKDVVILNDAEITFEVGIGSTTFVGGAGDYIIYGTTQNHRDLAEKVNRSFFDLNEAKLDAADNSDVNIDETNSIISGLTPKIKTDALADSCLSPKACDAIINSDTEYVGTGDKVNLVKWLDDSDAGSYDILLYGDVDGDGIYDARDAYLVNLMANGILTKDQVGSLKWSAADCNHDGEVNASDVLILEQAGLMLANVDQTKSGDELQEDAAFTDYVELIDQNPAADEVTEEKPASIFDRIIEFIKIIIDFVKSFIVKF